MAGIISKLNLSDPFMKALKAVNSVSSEATSLTVEDLKKQRTSMERAAKLATPIVGASEEAVTIDGVSCEWIRPDFAHNKKSIILYAHGGGYTCGGLSYARILGAKLALATGLEVLSIAYRLAPENKYPAALDDGLTVWDYLMKKGYGASDVILAGDSAGGNLVLCLTQKLKQAGRFLPKGLVLFSPWTDMTATSESYEKNKEIDPILSYNFIISVRDAYIGEGVDPAISCYSPLFGDFKDFPPTLIQVGENEILLDDSVSLAKKIHKAGGRAVLSKNKDGWHVYQQMPIPMASAAMAEVGAFVEELLYKM